MYEYIFLLETSGDEKMNHWSLEAVSARKSPDIRRPCKRERVGRNGKARNRRKEEMEAGMSKRENGSWIVGSKEGEMRRMHVAAGKCSK